MFKFKTRTKRKTKSSLSLFVALLILLLSTNLQAQDRPGGMFGLRPWFESSAMLRDGGNDEDYNITNEDFGEGVPLGSGIAILFGAGMGYMALKKKKEDKQ